MINDFLNEAIEQYKRPPFRVYPKEIAKDIAKGERKANERRTQKKGTVRKKIALDDNRANSVT